MATNPNTSGTIRQDLLTSIVVFLVALPLGMGIAIASGVPVAAGLISGIIGGIVVGFLAGCPLQVSGPAAGLTVIVFDIVQRLGLEMLGLTVLLAGLMQILAGSFRLGQLFRAVSPAVIKGMLAGIGCLIFAAQFHVMIDDAPKGKGITNLMTIPEAIWKALALPEFMPDEVRKFHAQSLREVGELRRIQVSLWERLVEHAPHAAHEEVADYSLDRTANRDRPEQVQVPPSLPTAQVVPSIASDQAALTERLSGIIEGLKEFESHLAKSERAQAILDAANGTQSSKWNGLRGRRSTSS